jgi:superfamily II DNA or RNA helicase
LKSLITITDEVHCRVQLEEARDMRHFVNRYAIPTKGYIFHPRYKIGAWDGKVNYFHPDGRTFNFLLEELCLAITQMGYDDVEIDDQRRGKVHTFARVDSDIFGHIIYPDSGEPIELADHQLRCINALLAETSGLIVAGTGAGKTLITAAMCQRFQEAGLRTLIIVPSLDLISNTREEMIMVGLTDVGEYSGGTKDIDHTHVVSTWQALKNVPILMKNFSAVIVDEVHGARSTELRKLLIEFGSHIVHRYGMTGTLPKDQCEAMAVFTALGPVRETVTAAELIAIGWLATIEVDQIELEENLRAEYDASKKEFGPPKTYQTFKKEYFPDFSAEKDFLACHELRTQWIANYYDNKRRTDGNTFVLVTGIDFGKELQSHIPDAHFVYGRDKVKARRIIYELFKENDNVLVFATVGVASTGLNIKRIFHLGLVDIGQSFIRVIQSIGRGLRRGRGKTHLQVSDVTSDLKYSTKHAKERIKYYKEAQYPVKRTKIVDYT